MRRLLLVVVVTALAGSGCWLRPRYDAPTGMGEAERLEVMSLCRSRHSHGGTGCAGDVCSPQVSLDLAGMDACLRARGFVRAD